MKGLDGTKWSVKDLSDQKPATYLMVTPAGTFFVEGAKYTVSSGGGAICGKTADGDDVLAPAHDCLVLPVSALDLMTARDALVRVHSIEKEATEFHKTVTGDDPNDSPEPEWAPIGRALSGGNAL